MHLSTVATWYAPFCNSHRPNSKSPPPICKRWTDPWDSIVISLNKLQHYWQRRKNKLSSMNSCYIGNCLNLLFFYNSIVTTMGSYKKGEGIFESRFS